MPMLSVTALALQTGVSGDLGRPLSFYLEALDGASRRAHRRAWRRLARAHGQHQYAVALLRRAGAAGAEAVARSALAASGEFAALADAERQARPALRRRPPEPARDLALRYAVAAMELDAALRIALD
jgi:hypothetical protein